MALDLVEIWNHMSVLARSIAFFLLLMMIASLGVVIERFWAFSKQNRATRAFVAGAAPLLKDWKLGKLEELATKHKVSPLAALFQRMTAKYQDALTRDGSLTPVELARGEAERRMEKTSADLRRGMSILASVGSVAPFVGLLGTVVGIMGTFAVMASSDSAGMTAVMTGISEALVETAFGLMVAIPAVLFYNYLTGRVAAIELALNGSIGELLDEMENNYGNDSKQRVEQAA